MGGASDGHFLVFSVTTRKRAEGRSGNVWNATSASIQRQGSTRAGSIATKTDSTISPQILVIEIRRSLRTTIVYKVVCIRSRNSPQSQSISSIGQHLGRVLRVGTSSVCIGSNIINGPIAIAWGDMPNDGGILCDDDTILWCHFLVGEPIIDHRVFHGSAIIKNYIVAFNEFSRIKRVSITRRRSHVGCLVDGDEVGINVFVIVVKGVNLEVSRAGCAFVSGNDIVNIVVFINVGVKPVVSDGIAVGIAEIHIGDNIGDVVIGHFKGAFGFGGLGTDLITAKHNGRCSVGQSQRDIAESDIAADLIRINPLDVADIFA